MMKRKFGDRRDWKRVLQRQYAQAYMETSNFTGFVCLNHIHKVSSPLIAKHNHQAICIADKGYTWLQYFPTNQHYSLTTMFNAEGEIIQFYIDICWQNGVNELGIPYMDDLYLDIILLADGTIILKDADELELAKQSGVINEKQYKLAKLECQAIQNAISADHFPLLQLAEKHRSDLMQLAGTPY